MGGGATVWTGNAFYCPWFSNNEIVLLHTSHFLSTSGGCNGAIVARGLSIDGNNYTSQLTVTVTPDTTGRTIMCCSDNGTHIIYQFSIVIPAIGLLPCIPV